MKRISTMQLRPGMRVEEDVMNLDHQLIIRKGTVLTDAIITKLNLYGILTVYIDENFPPVPEKIPHQSYYERVRKSKEFKKFKEEYDAEVDSFKEHLNSVVERNATIDVKEMLAVPLKLVLEAKGRVNVLDMLSNMREYDDSTFNHCLNVALICNVFATWLKLDEAEVEMATACGLFHDIGKLLIPREIVTKPGALTDEEYAVIKRHPEEGYRLLLDNHVDKHICNAALMHHERCDGGGYPLRLKDKYIDGYAKMVAIADVYDAMTSARVYRGPLCPFKVIEIFESEGLQRYDVNFVLTFLENICNTYIQNKCRLSDGREGQIIFLNKYSLSRPVVQCGSEYVDLSQEPNSLYIESLL